MTQYSKSHDIAHMTGEGESEVGVCALAEEGVVAVGDSGRPSSLRRWNRGEPMNVFIVWDNLRFHGDPGCCGDPVSYKQTEKQKAPVHT